MKRKSIAALRSLPTKPPEESQGGAHGRATGGAKENEVVRRALGPPVILPEIDGTKIRCRKMLKETRTIVGQDALPHNHAASVALTVTPIR